uniref:Uncharacterized protein n=1 Tax=Arundo donax TaxID=35708 RepID=A0A0A9C4H6_ARUDO
MRSSEWLRSYIPLYNNLQRTIYGMLIKNNAVRSCNVYNIT